MSADRHFACIWCKHFRLSYGTIGDTSEEGGLSCDKKHFTREQPGGEIWKTGAMDELRLFLKQGATCKDFDDE